MSEIVKGDRERENELISVIVSTYNRAEMLLKTVESILAQTYECIEVLVCDDGSTDNTKELMRRIEHKDSRIRFIECGHNGRPAIPRNIGISESKGEWLAFCDDDDVWAMTKLEAQLFMAQKYGVKACCTNAHMVSIDENKGNLYFKDSKTRLLRPRDLMTVNPVICSSMMIHKSLIPSCKGFPEGKEFKAIEDYAFWKRIVSYTDILFLNSPFVDYLMASSSSIRLMKATPFSEVKLLVDGNYKAWLTNQNIRIHVYYRIECLRNSFLSPFLSLKNCVLCLAKGVVRNLK